MDTVTVFTPRDSQAAVAVLPPEAEAQRTLGVAVTYLLSEEGRKASLLAGGDGRAVQRLTIQVPSNRLHLVTVDSDGVARLKLRPQYRHEAERIVRSDADPTYDAPPTLDELFRHAAQNHQLERAYHAARQAETIKRRDADRARRMQLAQRFLSYATQRALVHPAPTPRRCFLLTDHGRVLFDVATDDGPARDVPPEAHRRFRADVRARRDDNLQKRAAELTLHEEKCRLAGEWIERHGTPDQKARQAAGVLPLAEAIEAMTDEAFEALSDRPRYLRDGVVRLQDMIRRQPQHKDVTLAAADLVVTNAAIPHMTAEQWHVVSEMRRLLPEAGVTLRAYKVAWKAHPEIALPRILMAVVTQQVGPFTFRREYLAETSEAEAEG